MTAIITDEIRFAKIRNFISSLDAIPLYLGIGKSTPWTSDDGIGATEMAPATPTSSSNGVDLWDLLSVKRINKTNVATAIPRVNYNSWRTVPVDTKYSYYGEIGANASLPNYVLTSDYNVYKCITRASNVVSTIMPTSTSTTGTTTLADGYEWKYMYTITPLEAISMLTEEWIPVRTVLVQQDEISGSNQWNVQQNAVKGEITNVNIINGGTGYSSATNVPLVGNGTGAVVNVTASGGIITNVTVVSRGSGYSWARLDLPTGTNLNTSVVVSPVNGHGSDAVVELNARYMLCIASLNFNEGSGDFITANDYRKITLISTPLEFGGNLATTSTYDACYKYYCSSVSNVLVDDIVTDDVSGATAVVVEVNTVSNYVKINSKIGTFTAGHTVTFRTNGISPRNVTLISITNPELKPNSGSVLYKDYRRYITRDINQKEKLFIALEF
jgi:hypothetical protein